MLANHQMDISDPAGAGAPGKKARTRQVIISCTTALISERGYDNVTVTEIARAAGITPPTFYNHFSGKDAVLGDILLENHIGWARLVEERLGSDESIRVKLRALAVRNAAGLVEGKELFTALSHADLSPGSADEDRKTLKSIDRTFYTLIRKGQDNGEISTDHSAELLETIYIAAQQAINRKWSHGEISDDELEPTQLEVLELIVKGSSDG